MRPQQTRVSPLGRRRPISPLGPALLAAAAGVVLGLVPHVLDAPVSAAAHAERAVALLHGLAAVPDA